MSNNTSTGQIIHIGQIDAITDNLNKQVIVIKTEEKYSQEIPFDLVNKAITEYQHLKVNDMVTVHFNLRGSKAKTGNKWFANINAWKIEKHN